MRSLFVLALAALTFALGPPAFADDDAGLAATEVRVEDPLPALDVPVVTSVADELQVEDPLVLELRPVAVLEARPRVSHYTAGRWVPGS